MADPGSPKAVALEFYELAFETVPAKGRVSRFVEHGTAIVGWYTPGGESFSRRSHTKVSRSKVGNRSLCRRRSFRFSACPRDACTRRSGAAHHANEAARAGHSAASGGECAETGLGGGERGI